MSNTTQHEMYLSRALMLAEEHSREGDCGPFGAVIVRGDTIIAEGWNQVVSSVDPTAHAEIDAIRRACQAVGDVNLSDCVLYSSCEPCPMCLSAIYWARIPTVYYAATRDQAAAIGFIDEFIYDDLAREPSERKVGMYRVCPADYERPFTQWANSDQRQDY